MKISRKLAGGMVAAAVCGPAGFLLAQATGDDPPPLWRPAPTTDVVPATAAQKAAFSVLASTQRSEDVDNALVEDLAERSGVGMDADGARVVGATAAGDIWLIPANGGLCLGLENTADGSMGAACEPSGDVIARGMTVGDGGAVYGLAPDDTTAVSRTPDSVGTASPVTLDANNVYTIPVDPASVAVDRPAGLTSFGVNGGG